LTMRIHHRAFLILFVVATGTQALCLFCRTFSVCLSARRATPNVSGGSLKCAGASSAALRVTLAVLIASQLSWHCSVSLPLTIARAASAGGQARRRSCIAVRAHESEGPNDFYGLSPDDNFYYLTGWSEPAGLCWLPGPQRLKTRVQPAYTKFFFFPAATSRRRNGRVPSLAGKS